MKGKLYGIGTGPGDPELLTLKAVRAIGACDVVAVPGSESAERTAYNIVRGYLEQKTLLECVFSMDRDETIRVAKRQKVADDICVLLEAGKNVGFITLGDPCVYSTYLYIHKIIRSRGFDTEIIPGITSFSAAAAALNDSLCEGSDALIVIPAGQNENVKAYLDLPGNKVVMKSGKALQSVLNHLKESGRKDATKIVERATMDGQRVFNSIADYEKAEASGYFTVAIVKEAGI